MVIISHLHDDHIDPIAESLLPNNITILSQPEDESEIEAKGFCNLIPVADTISWKGISITRDWGTFVLNVQNYSLKCWYTSPPGENIIRLMNLRYV